VHTAHFRLTITNTGTQATSKTSPTQARLTVPHGLTHLHGSGHQWQCHKRHHTTSCTRGAPLQPGASTSITITARPGTSLTATAKTAPTDTTWHDNTAPHHHHERKQAPGHFHPVITTPKSVKNRVMLGDQRPALKKNVKPSARVCPGSGRPLARGWRLPERRGGPAATPVQRHGAGRR
jgi:hypothetical protein